MRKLRTGDKSLKEALLVLAIAFLWNGAVYWGARQLTRSWTHYDMTTSVDSLIPFLPWSVSIYFGCYLFWGVNYYLCAIQDEGNRDRFFCSDIMAKGACFLLFLLIPTTNVRPEITGNTIWDTLMHGLYGIDAADNLFPSIHCLVSWLCWIGIRKNKKSPFLYRHFSLAMAVSVCISTLTTRQHVLADVISGVALAEICYLLAGNRKIRGIYSVGLSRIKRNLWK